MIRYFLFFSTLSLLLLIPLQRHYVFWKDREYLLNLIYQQRLRSVLEPNSGVYQLKVRDGKTQIPVRILVSSSFKGEDQRHIQFFFHSSNLGVLASSINISQFDFVLRDRDLEIKADVCPPSQMVVGWSSDGRPQCQEICEGLCPKMF